jgi:mono/diheme cytochrome c family protein
MMKTTSLLVATPILLAFAQMTSDKSAARQLALGTIDQPAVVAIAGAAADTSGKTAYDGNCKKCHGIAGVPPKTMQAKFAKIKTFDSEFFAKRSDDSVVTVLMNGSTKDMKSFKEKLSHEQMKAVATYIRSFGK